MITLRFIGFLDTQAIPSEYKKRKRIGPCIHQTMKLPGRYVQQTPCGGKFLFAIH